MPQPFRRDAHHWLILHGRYVCKARKPECWRCVIADICLYRGQNARSGMTSVTDLTALSYAAAALA